MQVNSHSQICTADKKRFALTSSALLWRSAVSQESRAQLQPLQLSRIKAKLHHELMQAVPTPNNWLLHALCLSSHCCMWVGVLCVCVWMSLLWKLMHNIGGAADNKVPWECWGWEQCEPELSPSDTCPEIPLPATTSWAFPLPDHHHHLFFALPPTLSPLRSVSSPVFSIAEM